MKLALGRNRWWVLLAAALPAVAWGASPASSAKNESPARAVDLFAGMEAGEVEAVMIQKDSTEGTIMIKNKTDKPLTIKIPEAFGGVPILAQGRGGGRGGMGGMGGGMGGMGGGMQGMGGGMMGGMGGGMGGMGGGMGGMGGMMNVGAEKVQKIKIATVCLDHGKTDPNPRVPYKPVPLDSYAKDGSVGEVIKMMLAREIDQHTAQAAAWHLQNGLSWEELANKVGFTHLDGRKDPYFTAAQLERAFSATRFAKDRADAAAKEKEAAKSIGEKLAGQQ
jgi:hypothetical protein